MTPDERKDWEDVVADAEAGGLTDSVGCNAILAADAELIALRSEIEDIKGFFGDVRVVAKERDELRARVADVPNIIRGHKSHWQETFDRVQRDQLLDDVAAHVEAWLKEGELSTICQQTSN